MGEPHQHEVGKAPSPTPPPPLVGRPPPLALPAKRRLSRDDPPSSSHQNSPHGWQRHHPLSGSGEGTPTHWSAAAAAEGGGGGTDFSGFERPTSSALLTTFQRLGVSSGHETKRLRVSLVPQDNRPGCDSPIDIELPVEMRSPGAAPHLLLQQPCAASSSCTASPSSEHRQPPHPPPPWASAEGGGVEAAAPHAPLTFDEYERRISLEMAAQCRRSPTDHERLSPVSQLLLASRPALVHRHVAYMRHAVAGGGANGTGATAGGAGGGDAGGDAGGNAGSVGDGGIYSHMPTISIPVAIGLDSPSSFSSDTEPSPMPAPSSLLHELLLPPAAATAQQPHHHHHQPQRRSVPPHRHTPHACQLSPPLRPIAPGLAPDDVELDPVGASTPPQSGAALGGPPRPPPILVPAHAPALHGLHGGAMYDPSTPLPIRRHVRRHSEGSLDEIPQLRDGPSAVRASARPLMRSSLSVGHPCAPAASTPMRTDRRSSSLGSGLSALGREPHLDLPSSSSDAATDAYPPHPAHRHPRSAAESRSPDRVAMIAEEASLERVRAGTPSPSRMSAHTPALLVRRTSSNHY